MRLEHKQGSVVCQLLWSSEPVRIVYNLSIPLFSNSTQNTLPLYAHHAETWMYVTLQQRTCTCISIFHTPEMCSTLKLWLSVLCAMCITWAHSPVLCTWCYSWIHYVQHYHIGEGCIECVHVWVWTCVYMYTCVVCVHVYWNVCVFVCACRSVHPLIWFA